MALDRIVRLRSASVNAGVRARVRAYSGAGFTRITSLIRFVNRPADQFRIQDEQVSRIGWSASDAWPWGGWRRPGTAESFLRTRALVYPTEVGEVEFASPEELLDAGGDVYLLNASGFIALHWRVGQWVKVEASASSDALFIDVGDVIGYAIQLIPVGGLLSASFEIEDDTLFLGFGRETEQVSVTENDERVWAEIADGGQSVGLLSVGDVTTAGTEESATIKVRYLPKRAIGVDIIDDLNRYWTVNSSQISDDRRFVTYDVSRSIAVI
ncbi:MAG: hypothetical protein OXI80_10690 [Caldilineaceae bacterium]|nr:hypothetical protein [Caldilineaceae bacterium]